MRLEEGQNLLTDGEILAYVQVVIGEPALEKMRVSLVKAVQTGKGLRNVVFIGCGRNCLCDAALVQQVVYRVLLVRNEPQESLWVNS